MEQANPEVPKSDRSWSSLRLGFCFNTVAWNVYCITLLEHVAQLMPLTGEVNAAVSKAMRCKAPRPGTWCDPSDLPNLTKHKTRNGTRNAHARLRRSIQSTHRHDHREGRSCQTLAASRGQGYPLSQAFRRLASILPIRRNLASM